MTDEFALIERFLAFFDRAAMRALPLGPGDDAALLSVPPGETLAISTDTLIAGRHFPITMPAELIGWRALAVNLSDLAAMGATPYAFLVAITLPEPDVQWIEDCARGMATLARLHGAALAGGNLSRGELSLTITALGHVAAEESLRRSGAQVGDAVFVSGEIGLAGIGLREALALGAGDWPSLAQLRAGTAGSKALARYATPEPRIALGVALRGIATAALDISDGLLADLGHLCRASGVGAQLQLSSLPLPQLNIELTLTSSGADAFAYITAGDDYELCFTVPSARIADVASLARQLGIRVTRIGQIVEGNRVSIDGAVAPERVGYRHF